jgi:hypothetical protein
MDGMVSGISSLVRAPKDAALALMIRRLLNARLEAYGEVTELSLDTGRRRARIRMDLRGEAIPIEIEVRKYEIDHVSGGDTLTIVEVIASREWVTVALQQFVVGRRFHLPANAAAVARLLM